MEKLLIPIDLKEKKKYIIFAGTLSKSNVMLIVPAHNAFLFCLFVFTGALLFVAVIYCLVLRRKANTLTLFFFFIFLKECT